MERRRFLSLISAGVAGIALEQAIPLGRVWSFPSELAIPKVEGIQFLKVWDPSMGILTNRIDTLYGFGKLHEQGVLGNAIGFEFHEDRILDVQMTTERLVTLTRSD